jgi:hypothetical protein
MSILSGKFAVCKYLTNVAKYRQRVRHSRLMRFVPQRILWALAEFDPHTTEPAACAWRVDGITIAVRKCFMFFVLSNDVYKLPQCYALPNKLHISGAAWYRQE